MADRLIDTADKINTILVPTGKETSHFSAEDYNKIKQRFNFHLNEHLTGTLYLTKGTVDGSVEVQGNWKLEPQSNDRIKLSRYTNGAWVEFAEWGSSQTIRGDLYMWLKQSAIERKYEDGTIYNMIRDTQTIDGYEFGDMRKQLYITSKGDIQFIQYSKSSTYTVQGLYGDTVQSDSISFPINNVHWGKSTAIHFKTNTAIDDIQIVIQDTDSSGDIIYRSKTDNDFNEGLNKVSLPSGDVTLNFNDYGLKTPAFSPSTISYVTVKTSNTVSWKGSNSTGIFIPYLISDYFEGNKFTMATQEWADSKFYDTPTKVKVALESLTGGDRLQSRAVEMKVRNGYDNLHIATGDHNTYNQQLIHFKTIVSQSGVTIDANVFNVNDYIGLKNSSSHNVILHQVGGTIDGTNDITIKPTEAVTLQMTAADVWETTSDANRFTPPGSTITDSTVKTIVSTMMTGGTHKDIAVTYNSGTETFSIDASESKITSVVANTDKTATITFNDGAKLTFDASIWFATGPVNTHTIWYGYDTKKVPPEDEIKLGVSQADVHTLNGMHIQFTRPSNVLSKYLFVWVPDVLGTITGMTNGGLTDVWVATPIAVDGIAGKVYVSGNKTFSKDVTYVIQAT